MSGNDQRQTPELGRLDHPQAASLVGLALSQETVARPMESDPSVAAAHEPDRLFMPTLNAIRCNLEFKTKYQAMIKAGKPAKVAIVAIMRKLLILANALIRGQRKWPPAAP
jgi:transposase